MDFVQILSNVYCEETITDWSARPSVQLLQRIHQQGDSRRWIAAITTPSGEVVRIAIGDPICEYNHQPSTLYLAPWFCMHIGVIGDGSDSVSIQFERSEDLPRATELVVETIGEIPDGLDVRELLEDPLSQLGVLQGEMILPIPCLEGIAQLRVKQTKPAACVFLDGHDVALHFTEQNENRQEVRSRTPTPIPSPFFSAADINAPMVPPLSLSTSQSRTSAQAFGGVGRRLNGV